MDIDDNDGGFLSAGLGNKGGDVALQVWVDGEDGVAFFGWSREVTVGEASETWVDLRSSGGSGEETGGEADSNEGESSGDFLEFSQS